MFLKDTVVIPLIVLGNSVCDTHFSYTTEIMIASVTIDGRETLTLHQLVDYYLEALKKSPVSIKIIEHINCYMNNLIKGYVHQNEQTGSIDAVIDSIDLLKHVAQTRVLNEECRGLLDGCMDFVAMHRYKEKKALVIQKRFREAIANPCYGLCRQRLMREFEGMVGEA